MHHPSIQITKFPVKPHSIRRTKISPLNRTEKSLDPQNITKFRRLRIEKIGETTADRRPLPLVSSLDDYSSTRREKHVAATQPRLSDPGPSFIRRVNLNPVNDSALLNHPRYINSSHIRSIRKVDGDLGAQVPKVVFNGIRYMDHGGRGDSEGIGDDGHRGGRRGRKVRGREVRSREVRSREFDSGSSDHSDMGWDQEAMELAEYGLTRRPPPISEYHPAEVSMESLRGYGPAFASGLWGMSETVEERLAQIEGKRDHFAESVEFWAKKMVAGGNVSCPPSGWKSAKHRVEQLRAAARGQQQQQQQTSSMTAATSTTSPSSCWDTTDDSNKKTAGNDGNRQPHVITDEQKDAFVRKLVGGSYEMLPIGNRDKISSKKDGFIEQDLWRHAGRNGTYLPKDGKALVRKARMLIGPPKG